MSKLSALLGAILFHLTVIVSGVVITDLVTIKTGSTYGGCDGRTDILDVWYQESYQSLLSALMATARYNNLDADGQRVRKAMFSLFGIRNQFTKAEKPEVEEISLRFNQIVDWLEDKYADIPRDRTFLFCGSDFLVQKDPATQALDYQGNGLVDTNSNPVPISQVPAYQADLVGGNVPWWSGERTTINGYYFTSPDDGGNYCSDTEHLGLTSTLKELVQGPTGPELVQQEEAQTIVICPNAFESTAPSTYSEAVMKTTEGIKLDLVVPKSTTLLHEAFHVVLGTEFLQGNDEIYGLAECVDARRDPTKARKNPENYVYFIAAMHFLFGEPEDGIATNWDFATAANKAKAI
ncbi:hypothetical protein FHL15_009431 [Xylaria flabelliformis]|uniref:Lysine-specific metallo-endopeptidase domain-containing protein n=1 Tax=Xylaria flabelliformis TaxID=2512241 RepID=A0A553HP00_9PEZI|nr:hypothetical protein FHL15_009431 [Xylaria flabelliformis]